MGDVVKELRRGNLSVSGEARHINALLSLHRRAADEIELHRTKAAHYFDLHAFVNKVATDEYDRVSPGMKSEAKAILSLVNGEKQ